MINQLIEKSIFIFCICGCSNIESKRNQSVLNSLFYPDLNITVKDLLNKGYVPGNDIAADILKEEFGDTLVYYQFSDLEEMLSKPISKFIKIAITSSIDVTDIYKDFELDTICHKQTKTVDEVVLKNVKNNLVFTNTIYTVKVLNQYKMDTNFLYIRYDYAPHSTSFER